MTKKRGSAETKARVVDEAGRIQEPWRSYLADLPDKAATVDPLGASPTVGQISTAFNDLIAKLKAAKLME